MGLSLGELSAPAASSRLTSPTVMSSKRRLLLLAEALVEQKEYPAAEAALGQLLETDLTPEFKWRRQYLLCRAQMADRRLADALANTTNLLALATTSGERNFLAESLALQAAIEIFRKK